MSSAVHTRATILLLMDQAEDWISGEAISQHLGISRAAVAKHVAALRAEGHAIDAVTRKGYRLTVRHDALREQALTAALHTRVLGRAGWTFLHTTPSTNLVAAQLAAQGGEEGHVVVAETQTMGRGRKGFTWFSAPRSIQFSVVLLPGAVQWDAERFMYLGAQAVAAAVRDLTGLAAEIKMPNDVLIEGRKIAGVLVETGYRGNEPEWAVVGIGCNVNTLPEEFPEAVRGITTSLFAASGAPVSRVALLALVLDKLEAAYQSLHG